MCGLNLNCILIYVALYHIFGKKNRLLNTDLINLASKEKIYIRSRRTEAY